MSNMKNESRQGVTLVELVCQIAKQFNLDSSDLAAWTLEPIMEELGYNSSTRLTRKDVERILQRLVEQETRPAACTIRMIRVAWKHLTDQDLSNA